MAPFQMVEIAAEVLGRKLPVARNYPLMAADHLDTALATVEKRIQIPCHFTEVFAQRRRLGVKGGEQQPLVVVQLRHRGETPALPPQFAMIGLLEVRHSDEPAVIAVGPAMVSASECRSVAVIGAA